MTSNNIWLEVDKNNGAVMSYFLQFPTTPSSEYDYIAATQDELIYLNALEDAVLSPGMVATLSDLKAHRIRVQAEKNKATKTATTAPHKLFKEDSKPSNITPPTSTNKAKASLIAALKQHRSSK